MDDNGSRTLDYEEFQKGLREFGVNFRDEEIKDLFKKFDKDSSGSINFDEFLLTLRVSYFFIHQKILEISSNEAKSHENQF